MCLIFRDATAEASLPRTTPGLEQRADNKQRNETDAATNNNDKEFDVYLEQFMSANPRALVLKAQPNGQIENEVTK